ncbi:TOMM precursor leader peptide-binding protein [Micromonospora sp. DT228]|uniref:TOMM precursor leader peptide-binding protein n=1 Tax=Micromonospora sp. DT228 TaxID=3393443 RepID=UPI003CFA4F6F
MTDTAAGPRIGFRRHLRLEIVAREAAYLFSEHGVTALQGEEIEVLAPLLDGTRDVAAVLRDTAPALAGDRVGPLLRQLAEAGLLVVSDPVAGAVATPPVAYWEAAGLDGHRAHSACESGSVRLLTVGGLADGHLRSALAAAGLASGTAAGADLSVVACADYLDPALADIDAEHRAAGRPWLLARPVGAQLWLGPIFTPGTGCWHCMAHRLWLHRPAEAHVQKMLGRTGPVARPAATIHSVSATAGELVAMEAAKWLAGYRYAGQRAVWVLDTLTMQGHHHRAPHRPQCAACGRPDLVREQTRRPVVLRQRTKVSTTGGGHRSMTPEDVQDTFSHLVSPVTGIVREIRRDTRGPTFLNAFRAGANLATRPNGIEDLRSSLRSEHGGKGVTTVQAEVSALCEALERHSGSYHGDELRERASLRDLGSAAVHPDAVRLVHERQYAGRHQWNEQHSALQWIGDPFDESAALDWTPVWSLTGNTRRYLPTAMLYYGTPPDPGSRGLYADSNGNAAGCSLEDAVLQGFLELVERDAVALWWYNRTRMPEVDLGAFADEWLDELRRVHRDLGREVWVLDLTTDLGVPAMVALSRRVDKPAEDIVFGFGAHFDPAVALRRALTELNQLLPAAVGADGRGQGYGCADPEALRWWRHATVAGHPYLSPQPDTSALGPADYGYVPTVDLQDDVRRCMDIVTARGLELMVLDQTRPDIGLPVAKVIVPGLRHFWARFAPGRLYDVPVQLGRLSSSTAFEDLNPVPLFV